MSGEWTEESGTLRKTFTFETYSDGIAFAVRVGNAAEEADHHPEIIIGYKRVTVVTTSHDAGNSITERDRQLAVTIDGL